MCDRSTLIVNGNVKIVWIKYQYLNGINIPDVLCFFPETEIWTSDNTQRTPTTLQPRLAAQAAASHTTSVWQVCGVLLWVVALSEAAIRHQSSPPLSLFCCAVNVMCVVCRASCAPREKEYGCLVLWSNGHDARFRI